MYRSRFPVRSDSFPTGMRKTALAAAWQEKMSPVWVMEIPALRA